MIGPKIDAIATRLAALDVTEAIADALAIHGLVGQINEVIHMQRTDIAAIAVAQTASDVQSENDRADIKTLLTRLHTLAQRHAARLTSWERAQLEAADAAAIAAAARELVEKRDRWLNPPADERPTTNDESGTAQHSSTVIRPSSLKDAR